MTIPDKLRKSHQDLVEGQWLTVWEWPRHWGGGYKMMKGLKLPICKLWRWWIETSQEEQMLSVLISSLTCFADLMHTLPAKEEFSSIIIIIIVSSSSSSSSHAYTTGIRSATTVFVPSSVLASDIRPSSALGSHHDYCQHNQKNKQHQHHNININTIICYWVLFWSSGSLS